MCRSYRLTLGPHFNEGARLLWGKLAEFASLEAMRLAVGAHRGELSRILYGDRLPGLPLANRIADKLGIPTTAWEQPATVPFTPPAAVALGLSPEAP